MLSVRARRHLPRFVLPRRGFFQRVAPWLTNSLAGGDELLAPFQEVTSAHTAEEAGDLLTAASVLHRAVDISVHAQSPALEVSARRKLARVLGLWGDYESEMEQRQIVLNKATTLGQEAHMAALHEVALAALRAGVTVNNLSVAERVTGAYEEATRVAVDSSGVAETSRVVFSMHKFCAVSLEETGQTSASLNDLKTLNTLNDQHLSTSRRLLELRLGCLEPIGLDVGDVTDGEMRLAVALQRIRHGETDIVNDALQMAEETFGAGSVQLAEVLRHVAMTQHHDPVVAEGLLRQSLSLLRALPCTAWHRHQECVTSQAYSSLLRKLTWNDTPRHGEATTEEKRLADMMSHLESGPKGAVLVRAIRSFEADHRVERWYWSDLC